MEDQSGFFSLRRNHTSLYLVKVAKWMNLVMPIIVLFYKSNGMSMQDIFTLQAVYSFTLMVLEIPTGYFADTAGRRTSILLGSVFGFGGYLIYSISSGFWQFALAETILGCGMSLVSGADSAMLYDSLKSVGKSAKYTRYEGRITSIGNFAEAAAGIIGGLLAVASLRTPYYFQAGVAFIAIPAALFLKDPPVHGHIRKPGVRDVIKIVRKVLHGDRKLTWNTIFSAVTGASTLTMAWFAQPYFHRVGLPISVYGVAWAVLNLSVGLTAIIAWKVEARLGAPRIVGLFTVLLFLSYMGLALTDSLVGLIFLLIFYLARGLATVTLRNYINIITSSDIRATVLSVRNFIIRLIFVITGPLFGWITDHYGLRTAIFSAGTIFGLLGTISMVFFIRFKTFQAQ
ncbi:MAG: MFS transporter [Bacteroidetes bacterium]|nr:MFS transporter [Bacteroidota bacterium]